MYYHLLQLTIILGIAKATNDKSNNLGTDIDTNDVSKGNNLIKIKQRIGNPTLPTHPSRFTRVFGPINFYS